MELGVASASAGILGVTVFGAGLTMAGNFFDDPAFGFLDPEFEAADFSGGFSGSGSGLSSRRRSGTGLASSSCSDLGIRSGGINIAHIGGISVA